MDTLVEDVVHQRWDRLGYRPDVLVGIQCNEHTQTIKLKVMTAAKASLASTDALAVFRVFTNCKPFALYETTIGEFHPSKCDALVGFIPNPRMPAGECACIQVSIIPKIGDEWNSLVTVRSSDVLIPAWRGVTFVPTVNHTFACRNDAVTIRPMCHEYPPLLVCAHATDMAMRHQFALSEKIILPGRQHTAGFNTYLYELHGEPLAGELHLPNIWDALCESGSQQRVQKRTRLIQKELVEMAWSPWQMARAICSAGGDINVIDDL